MQVFVKFGILAISLAWMTSAQVALKSVSTNLEKTSSEALFTPIKNPAMPVLNPSSSAMICRSPNLKYSGKPLSVGAGEKLTLTWDTETKPLLGGDSYMIQGPCTVYMSSVNDSPTGANWFKVYQKAWDATGFWCSQQVNKKPLEITIPADIADGDYRIRTEVIDLTNAKGSNAVDPSQGPQFYVNCALITVSGGKDANPPGVSMTSVYKNLKALQVDMTDLKAAANYVIPGPPVYTGSEDTTTTTTTENNA